MEEIRDALREDGVGEMPLGVDLAETSVFLELQNAGIEVRDGQQVMAEAREIKNVDEITLLTQACAMVDGVYQDIFEALKPGISESDIVAVAHHRGPCGSRPGIGDHVATPHQLRARAAELFDWVRSGDLDVRIAGTYPLEQAAAAYGELRAGG